MECNIFPCRSKTCLFPGLNGLVVYSRNIAQLCLDSSRGRVPAVSENTYVVTLMTSQLPRENVLYPSISMTTTTSPGCVGEQASSWKEAELTQGGGHDGRGIITTVGCNGVSV